MAQNITIAGVSYPDVPSVNLAKTGGGVAPFIDVSGTTATAADVKNGKTFYLANGNSATGSLVWDWMGDDAECINNNVHSFSATLDFTDYATWTPSTTAAIIVPSESMTAVSINTGTYDYLIRWVFEADIAYKSGTSMVAVPIRQVIEMWQAVIKRPSSLANLKVPTYTANACLTMFTAPILDYYNTSGSNTMTYTASYGFYPSAVAATFSSSTSNSPKITIKTPAIYARCNSSYFAVARGADVDQANSTVKLHGELWRVKRSNAVEEIYENAVYFYNNPLPTYNYGIRNTLANCTTSNSATLVSNGQSYSATITADENYKLEGATVSVTMGNTDITSSAYNNGVISIANVSGNVVITVTAVPIAPVYTNLADPTSPDWLTGYRLDSNAQPVALANNYVTNFIPVSAGDIVRVKNMSRYRSDNAGANVLNGVKADKTSKVFSIAYSGSTMVIASVSYDDATQTGTIQVIPDGNIYGLTYMRIGAALSPNCTVNDVIITVNEEIG